MPWFKLKVTIEQDVMICADRYSDAVQNAMDKRDFPTSRVFGICRNWRVTVLGII